jgi:hypothetical protein
MDDAHGADGRRDKASAGRTASTSAGAASAGPRELVALLAEPDRLRALAAVTLGAATLPEVAERTGLEPRAAARALSRLVAGGLVEGDAGKGYRVLGDAFKAAARRTADTGSGGAEAAGSPKGDVLRRFIHNGRLLAMPAAHSKRLVVLDHLAGLFEPGRRYPEREVNELLGRYHPDYAMLRRYLVDDGFLDRADEQAKGAAHSVKVYWRTGGTVELSGPISS